MKKTRNQILKRKKKELNKYILSITKKKFSIMNE